MSQVKNVIQRDEFVTDDVGVVRLLGTHVDRGTMHELLVQTYLKRKIGSTIQQAVTLSQDASQSSGTGQLPDIANDNRILRHATLGGVNLTERMIEAGVCKRVTPSNAQGYPGLSLQNEATLITNEAVADAADRLVWDPTQEWSRNLPPLGGAFNHTNLHYRRFFADATDGGNTAITYLLGLFGNAPFSSDKQLTHAAITAGYSTLAVNGEWFNIPAASSPTCRVLYILYETDASVIEYMADQDAEIIKSKLISHMGRYPPAVPYIQNSLVTDIWDRVFAQHVIAIGFPSGATNEQAIIEADWIKTADLENVRHPSTGRNAPSRVNPPIPSTASSGGISNAPRPGQKPKMRRGQDWIPNRSAIAELGVNRRTFFSGTDAMVFINGQFLDQATTVGHSISITSKPQFDYHRVHSKFVSRGKVAVAGVLRFPMVVPHLLQTLIKLTESNVRDAGFKTDFINSSIAALPSTIVQLRQKYAKALSASSGPDTDLLHEVIDQINTFNISQALLLHLAPELANTSNTGQVVEVPIGSEAAALYERTAVSREAGFLNDTAASLSVFVGAADFVNFGPDRMDDTFVFNYEDVWFSDISTGFNPSANAVEAQVSFIARQYKEYQYGQDTEKELFASRPGGSTGGAGLSIDEIVAAAENAARVDVANAVLPNDGRPTPSHLVKNIPHVPTTRQFNPRPGTQQPQDTTYVTMWDNVTVTDSGAADTAEALIVALQARYERVAAIVDAQISGSRNLPWWIIGLIHYRETGTTDFTASIIDGIGDLDDDGKDREGTHEAIHDHANHHQNKPAAEKWEHDAAWHFLQRHAGGGEPYTIETTWDVSTVLRYLEGWNGFAYWYKTQIYNPYLFANTQYYTTGKWIHDGADGFEPTTTDSQQGTIAILKSMEGGTISPLVLA